MDNIIILKFDKTTTNLVGNRLGNDIYIEQIEKKLDLNKCNVIIFPKNIEDIASSFIEGLYKKIGKKHGKTKALEIMILKAENDEANEKIIESIDTFGV